MKRFKDLKVGNPIYVEFEKLFITDIKMYIPMYSYRTICASNGKEYVVHHDKSDEFCPNNLVRVFVDKEAMISYYKRELEDWETNYLNYKVYFEKKIEKAKRLE